METAVGITRVGASLAQPIRHLVGPVSAQRVDILNGFARDHAGASRDGAFSLKWMPAGAARYAVDGREHSLSGERVLILDADQPYEIAFERGRESESFCLFFSPGLIADAGTPVQATDIVFRPPTGLADRLRRLRIHLDALEREPELLEGAVLRLLAELTDVGAAHRLTAQRLPGRATTRRRLLGQLQRAREMIEDHAGRPPSLSVLAAAVGLSKFHFLRLFTAAYGIGPATYAERCRLGRAGALLRQTTLPVGAIAERAGYDSPAAFAKAFRRRFGMAPRAFRAGAE